MKKFRLAGLLLCIVIFIFSSAMVISNAVDIVNTSENSSLTLTYCHGDICFEDLNINIYRVAKMTGNVYFELAGDYSGTPVELNRIKSQREWNEAASTLYGYTVSKGIRPTAQAVTDDRGNAVFDNLETGLYLVEGVRVELDGGQCSFDSFVITIPGVDQEGKWLYDVKALPKSSYTEPEIKEVEYKVCKLWKDDGNRDKRPQSVQIDIFKDGQLEETVTLSSENDWTYVWTYEEGHTWTAVEKDVAEGYTVTSVQNQNSFIIVNTYDSDTPPPQTGDFSDVYLIVAILSAVGALLLLAGLFKRKGESV